MPLSEEESDEEEERLARLKARREVIVLMDPADGAAMLRSMSWEDAGQLLVLMGEERSAPTMEALTAKERSDMAAVVPAAILEAPAGQLAPAAQPTAAAAGASTKPAAAPVAHADATEPTATAKPAAADAGVDAPAAVATSEKPTAPDAEAAPEPSAAQAAVADPAAPTAHVATAVADAEEQPTLGAAGVADLQSEYVATQGSKSSAATATAASQSPFRGPPDAGNGGDVSEAVLFSAAAAAQTPGSAGVEPAALSAKPGVCEEDEGDGIHAAWVIGNQRMAQGPGIVPVRTLGHSSWAGQDLDDGPDDEAFLSGGSRPGGGLASRLKSSVPSKVSEMGGKALGAAGNAAGLARNGLAAAASSSERAMGAAGSAAGVARQSLALAAPAKVTELGQKAREAASTAADRARQSGVAHATGQRAGEATAAAKLIATEAKEKAKEKFAGAADAAKSGLARASQSFTRFTRKS